VKKKRVFVVGAGFSMDAGYPKQSEILKELNKSDDKRDKASMEFVRKLFPDGSEPTLEDLFTLLDQTIETRINCGQYNWKELEEWQSRLNFSILSHFYRCASNLTNADFYRSVAAEMIKERLLNELTGDPFSIISLNWDTLLEDSIFWCIEKAELIRKIDIDYGCYTTPLEPSPHVTSLRQKSEGIFNLKLIKVHGSANWRICPGCNRLFTNVGVNDELWDYYSSIRPCPECKKLNPWIDDEKLLLEPFIITPTFVKKFNNAHIQMVWHNAYIELSEATSVVFAGYSLPEADYHLRGLLVRAIQPSAEITVITKGNMDATVDRYRNFFGKQCVNIFEDGILDYYDRLPNRHTLDELIEEVKVAYSQQSVSHS
jgi:NAD-dependent SIR2 family protein deacetylase